MLLFWVINPHNAMIIGQCVLSKSEKKYNNHNTTFNSVTFHPENWQNIFKKSNDNRQVKSITETTVVKPSLVKLF